MCLPGSYENFGEIFAIFSSIFDINYENLCGFSRELEEELRGLFRHWYLTSKSVNEWMNAWTDLQWRRR